jgi:hypothetical protein
VYGAASPAQPEIVNRPSRYVFSMGFLDRAKKLAEQAKDMAEGALANANKDTGTEAPAKPSGGSVEYGTPYVEGMLGRPGWRERGLEDPAALLPIRDRDRVGVPHSTKSKIIEEPFGMGRRWSTGDRSAALFYQLYPEHQAWEPPGGKTPYAGVTGASAASLEDGRSLVFLARGKQRVVLELTGLEPTAQTELATVVATKLAD